MKCLLALLPLAFFLQPAQVMGQEVQCPGENTLEMRACAALDLDESNKTLRSELPGEIFDRWQQTTKEVCTTAYAPYRQGSIYREMIIRCDDNLNRALLKELKGLGEN